MVNSFRCQKCDKSFDLWVRLRVHNMNNHRNDQRLIRAPLKVTNLPDEVLCLVFSNITSVRDKFRVAAVNTKFRQCMFKEMKRPHPLEMDFHHDQREWRLCDHVLDKGWWLRVLRLLIEKEARFSSIVFSGPHPASRLELDEFFVEILQLLINPQCLSQVTQIWVKPSWFDRRDSVAGLDLIISKCKKLSILKLQFCQVPTRQDRKDRRHPALDLIPSINNKPITELDLSLTRCTQPDLIDVLRAPKPNTLRKFRLHFTNPMGREPNEPEFIHKDPDFIQLVKELCLDAPESMEEIQLSGGTMGGDPYLPPISELIACIPRLPSLRCLHFEGGGLVDHQLLVSTMKLLLSNHARQTPLVVQYHQYKMDQLPCCQILACIRQMKQQLPGLVFGYDHKMKKMKLKLGSVTVGMQKFNKGCDDPNCGDCHSSYPVVVHALGHEAEKSRDCKLDNHWLSRCKINSVVEDLGNMRHCCQFPRWEAIDAKENESHTKATVSCKERSHGRFGTRGKEFSVTIDIGRCFDTSCVQCTGE